MMLSRPIASGVMLVAIAGLFGAALLQPDPHAQDDAVQTAIPATQNVPAQQSAPERQAAAPDRVVDSAGFPVVPEGERTAAAAPGPIVTVNGRPLNEDRAAQPAQPATTASTTPRTDAVPATQPEQSAAIAEPPRPIPRPEGLVAPAQPAIDYDAVAAAASAPWDDGEFMSYEQRRALAPVAGETGYGAQDPRQDGLVAIVGPSGQTIWVYEDQLRANESRVTIQSRQVQTNPYGFVYDDADYRW